MHVCVSYVCYVCCHRHHHRCRHRCRHSRVGSSKTSQQCQLVIAFCITMSHRPTPCQLRLLLLATDVAVSDMMRMQQGAQFVVSRLTYVPFVTWITTGCGWWSCQAASLFFSSTLGRHARPPQCTLYRVAKNKRTCIYIYILYIYIYYALLKSGHYLSRFVKKSLYSSSY